MEKLKINGEDLEDLIVQIEDSFKVRFESEEIQNNFSIEELANLVISKLELKEGIECSSQITFFRLRRLLADKLSMANQTIDLDTELKTLFPPKNRRNEWQRVFADFEFQAPKLEPPREIFLSAILIAIISFMLTLFEFWRFGFPLFFLSSFTIVLCIKFGRSLPSRTMRQLVENIVKHDYHATRQTYGTYNPAELRTTIFSLLTDLLTPKEKQGADLKTRIDYIED
ncbi:MAG: hypothetical protein RIB71_15240 [Imperialibacter sp.]|uniref:hypothetical protein n=1 Tax=Imperialibacter sp. TaxID=2038411 RepID=UPI0032ED3F42